MKTCSRCGRSLPLEDFTWKDKAKSKRHYACRDCMREYIRNHYKNHTRYYVEKAHRRKKRYLIETYAKIKEYFLAHPCADCGEADPVVLEFDHIDRSTKTAAISVMIKFQRPWRVILQEIEKCEVRCANCHRRRTATQCGWRIHAAPESKERLTTKARRASL